MKNKFKFLAAILATLMLVSFIPLAAFAEEIEYIEEPEDTIEEDSIETIETEVYTETYEPTFTLPDNDENITYELISKNTVKVTVFPNVTESSASDNGTDLHLPGKLDVVNVSDSADPLKIGNDMIDLGGGSGGVPSPIDTYISSAAPSTNYGNSAEAQVTNNKILYISYPMPYIPEYATLVEANVNIAYVYDDPTQAVEVYVHKVNISWTETGLTWNVANQNTRLGLEQRYMSITTISDPQGISVTTPRFAQFDILDAAQEWLSGESENNGVALKTYGQLIKFKTSEALSTYRPSFEYVYSVPAPIENGTYRIHNVETERYIDIKDASTNYGANITQDAFNDAARQEWILNFGSDGYYTIKSAHSNKYIGLDTADLNNIKQYTSPTDYCKWAIRETTSGNYIFVCKATNDEYVLSANYPNSGNGSVLVGKVYTDDTERNDEWNLGIPVRFENIHLNVGETTTVNIQADCPAGYVNVTDYRYTILDDGDEYINVSNITGEISAIDIDDDICTPDVVTVIATHKEYLLTYSFNVTVYSGNVLVSIYSSYEHDSGSSYWFDFGHSFLTFFNDSKNDIVVGYATAAPKAIISIGAWGYNVDLPHRGIYYNREIYDIYEKNWFLDAVYITESVSPTIFSESSSAEDSVNYAIRNWNNDYWLTDTNCSTFATDIWNLLSSEDFTLSWPNTPSELKDQIEDVEDHQTISDIPEITYYGYYDINQDKMIAEWGEINEE